MDSISSCHTVLPSVTLGTEKQSNPLVLNKSTNIISALNTSYYSSSPVNQGILSRETFDITKRCVSYQFPIVQYTENAMRCAQQIKKQERNIRFTSTRLHSLYFNRLSELQTTIADYDSQTDEQREAFIKRKVDINQHDGSVYGLLAGEDQLIARKNLMKGELIAHYAGTMLTNKELTDSHIPESIKEQMDEYSVKANNKLTVVGLNGNPMSCINDGTIKDSEGKRGLHRENVELVTVFCPRCVEGEVVQLPGIYVFANKPIKQGEILWLSYGTHFWENKANQLSQIQPPELFASLGTNNHTILNSVGYILEGHLIQRKTIEACYNELSIPHSVEYVRFVYKKALLAMQFLLDQKEQAQQGTSALSQTSSSNAAKCTDKKIRQLARLLGIGDPDKIGTYIKLFETNLMNFSVIKKALNASISQQNTTLKKVAADVQKPRNNIVKMLRKFIEYSQSHSHNAIAGHYYTNPEQVRQWLGHKDKMLNLLKQPHMHPFELLSDHKKAILRSLFSQYHSRQHHSQALKSTLQSHPDSFSPTKAARYISTLRHLVMSDKTQDRLVLFRLGYSDLDIEQLRVAIQSSADKRSDKVKAVANWLDKKNEDASLDRSVFYQEFLEAYPDIRLRQGYTVLLHANKLIMADPTGTSAADYLCISKEKALLVTKAFSQPLCKAQSQAKRKSDTESKLNNDAPQRKMIKHSPSPSSEHTSSDSYKVDILRCLFTQQLTRRQIIDTKDIYHNGQRVSQYKKRRVFAEWNQFAEKQCPETIREQYGISIEEATHWLNGHYTSRVLHSVSEATKLKNKEAFFQLLCNEAGSGAPVNRAKEKIMRSSVTTHKQVNGWISAWKNSPHTNQKNAEALARELGISVDLTPTLIKIYHTDRNHKGHLSAANLKPCHLQNYFSQIYLCRTGNKREKRKLAEQLEQKYTISKKQLLSKSKAFEKLVKDGQPANVIAQKTALPNDQFLARCIQALTSDNLKMVTDKQNAVKLFQAIWTSKTTLPHVAKTARSLGFDVNDAYRWCAIFQKKINRGKYVVEKLAEDYGCPETDVETWIRCMKAATAKRKQQP